MMGHASEEGVCRANAMMAVKARHRLSSTGRTLQTEGCAHALPPATTITLPGPHEPPMHYRARSRIYAMLFTPLSFERGLHTARRRAVTSRRHSRLADFHTRRLTAGILVTETFLAI